MNKAQIYQLTPKARLAQSITAYSLDQAIRECCALFSIEEDKLVLIGPGRYTFTVGVKVYELSY